MAENTTLRFRTDPSGTELVAGHADDVQLDAVLNVPTDNGNVRTVRVKRVIATMGELHQAIFVEGDAASRSVIPPKAAQVNGTRYSCAQCGQKRGPMHVVTDSSGIYGWACWDHAHTPAEELSFQ